MYLSSIKVQPIQLGIGTSNGCESIIHNLQHILEQPEKPLAALSAPHASDWKAAIPSNSDLTLNDSQYRIAAKLNLGMKMDLPDDCHSCGVKDAVKNDPFHYLSCNHHKRREITIRHNLVLHALVASLL